MYKTLRKSLFLIVVIIVSYLSPQNTWGQFDSPVGNMSEILAIDVRPKFPGPNSQVTINITSHFTDLNSANISWGLNGQRMIEGIGERNFSFVTGDLGSVQNIDIIVDPSDSSAFLRRITIRPTEVDIIWESDTYVPNFYKGKQLYSQRSILRLTAMPYFINSNGNKISDDSLIYTWKVFERNLSNSSGYGKNSAVISGTRFEKGEKITLKVESSDKSYVTEKTINIGSVDPKIVFYQRDPLYGNLFNKAIEGEFELKGQEFTVFASPFFVSGKNILNEFLSFSWFVNNLPGNGLSEEPNVTTLRRDIDSAGTAIVSFSAQHQGNILQSAKNSFVVSFK